MYTVTKDIYVWLDKAFKYCSQLAWARLTATSALERKFWRTIPGNHRISQKGISAFSMHYWSQAMNNTQQIGVDGTVRFTLRYNPDDITRLAVFRDGVWLFDVLTKERLLPDGSIRPLSLTQWTTARRLALAEKHGKKLKSTITKADTAQAPAPEQQDIHDYPDAKQGDD